MLNTFMDAIQLLKQQLKSAHETMESTMDDVTDSIANFNQIKKALPVGAAYAHAVIGEDISLSTILSTKTPLSESEETGLSEPMPSMEHWDKHAEWAQNVKVDIIVLRSFAKKVYLATEDYLATLKAKDLDTEIDIPGMGKYSLAWILTNFIILHMANLTGEISAAKGFQDLKGYTF